MTGVGPQVDPSKLQSKTPEGDEPEGKAAAEKPAHPRRERMMKRSLEQIEHTATRVGSALERPIVGAGVAGGLIAAAAGLWGPTEAFLGAAVGVYTYRKLRRRRERMRHEEPQPEQHGADEHDARR